MSKAKTGRLSGLTQQLSRASQVVLLIGFKLGGHRLKAMIHWSNGAC